MRDVTFHGPQDALRLKESGRILKRGVRTQVTDAEAERLAQSARDVTVHRPASDDDD